MAKAAAEADDSSELRDDAESADEISMRQALFIVFLFIAGCSAQWQGPSNALVPGGTPAPGVPPTYQVVNFNDGLRTRSGFVNGTATGNPTIGCQFDGGAVVTVNAGSTWRCPLPGTWRPGSSHTVKAGIWNGTTFIDPATYHIVKEENRDLNGDGIPDAAVGDQYANGQHGAAYVYNGTTSGLSSTSSATVTSVQAASNHFGYSVRIADVNGDGFADLLVAAPDYDFGTGHAGAVHVYFGSASGISTTPGNTVLNPGTEGFASWIVVGDVNGDGYADLVVGTTSSTAMVGQYVYFGSPTGYPSSPSVTLATPAANFNGAYGMAVGDLNGDGYDDVAVGIIHSSTGFNGEVFVFYGAPGTSMSGTAGANFTRPGQCFGESLAIGDVNGDGIGDLGVGQTCASQTGAAYIYNGSLSGVATSPSVTMTGHTSDETFGTSVAIADFNNDGFGDFIVGAPYYTSNTGAMYIYNGSGGGPPSVASDQRYGTSVGEYFAFILQPTDLNNDGFPDLFIGSYGGANGFAQVYTSDASGLSATPALELVGPNAGGFFGWAVAANDSRHSTNRWAAPFFSLWQFLGRFVQPPPVKRVPPLPPRAHL